MAPKRPVFTLPPPTPWHHGMAQALFCTHLHSFDGPIAMEDQRPPLKTPTRQTNGRPQFSGRSSLQTVQKRPFLDIKSAVERARRLKMAGLLQLPLYGGHTAMEAKVAFPVAYVGLQPCALLSAHNPGECGHPSSAYLLIQHRSNGLHKLAIPHNHVQQPWGNATPKETMEMERASALALVACAMGHGCAN